jgi:hypothetical protein
MRSAKVSVARDDVPDAHRFDPAAKLRAIRCVAVAQQIPGRRRLPDLCGHNVFRCDWLAERGGFEPPRPFRLSWTEFGPSLAHYSARIKASVLERICSPETRLCFGSLRFPSFALMRGIWGRRTSDEGKVWSSNLRRLAEQAVGARAERDRPTAKRQSPSPPRREKTT